MDEGYKINTAICEELVLDENYYNFCELVQVCKRSGKVKRRWETWTNEPIQLNLWTSQVPYPLDPK